MVLALLRARGLIMQQQVERTRTQPFWHTTMGAAPQRRSACSACAGSVVLNEHGEVMFCEDCLDRARADTGMFELGGLG